MSAPGTTSTATPRTRTTATPAPTDRLRWATLPSPVGELLLVADDAALVSVAMPPWERPGGTRDDDGPVLGEARRQLDAYFAGTRTGFDLPLSLRGSPFQRRVWQALTEIPYGQTWSYGQLARRLGDPGLTRAVGAANGRNPVAVVVPCHRVIEASGRLGGYAGGLDRKRTLLALEARVAVGRAFGAPAAEGR